MDITNQQIIELQQEAGSHGDHEQVAICIRALEGDRASVLECKKVIMAGKGKYD